MPAQEIPLTARPGALSTGLRPETSYLVPAASQEESDDAAEHGGKRNGRPSVVPDIPIRRLTGHTGMIGAMAFAPSGTVLATGAEDGTVRLWDPRTGKELARLVVTDPAPGGGP